MSWQKSVLWIVIGIAVIVLTGGWWVLHTRSTVEHFGDTDSENTPSLINQTTLSRLAHKKNDAIDTSHIKPGLAPPTNTWFSGFALQKDPQPAFAFPNSYRPTSTGFEMSLPHVSATKDMITAGHMADVVVTFKNAEQYQVTRYDELSVDVTYYDKDSTPLVSVTIAAGVPYAFIRPQRSVSVTTNLADAERYDDKTHIQTIGGHVYGLATSTKQPGTTISLSTADTATVFSAPNRAAISEVAQNALNPVRSGTVSYKSDGNEMETTLHYKTSNGKPTLIATLPHQQSAGMRGTVYRSIFGDLVAFSGNKLTYSTPVVPLKTSLDLSGISSDEKKRLGAQLEKDADKTVLDKPDTYYAGKQLYRAAQLLDIAAQLKAMNIETMLRKKLNTAFDVWLRDDGTAGGRSFYYDETAQGIVGNEASFGADKEFNDHHFHYGYFIYAAAVLARYDEDFAKRHGDMINLLVADIANYRDDEKLPLRRSFDAYAGHSWASGTAPFRDGNNQESVSEAINAWTGVALWARQVRNKPLEHEANWLLANEVASARAYWFNTNPTDASYLKEYVAPLASINWGAKRGYQTFFSNETNAKLGIELIPMNPTMVVLSKALGASQLRGIDEKGTFGDYILMARSGSFEEARQLPDSAIDDGDSRTYLYAWTLSR